MICGRDVDQRGRCINASSDRSVSVPSQPTSPCSMEKRHRTILDTNAIRSGRNRRRKRVSRAGGWTDATAVLHRNGNAVLGYRSLRHFQGHRVIISGSDPARPNLQSAAAFVRGHPGVPHRRARKTSGAMSPNPSPRSGRRLPRTASKPSPRHDEAFMIGPAVRQAIVL